MPKFKNRMRTRPFSTYKTSIYLHKDTLREFQKKNFCFSLITAIELLISNKSIIILPICLSFRKQLIFLKNNFLSFSEQALKRTNLHRHAQMLVTRKASIVTVV